MSRLVLVRALLVALVTALVVFPAPALAAQPIEQFHDHFTDSFSDEICGIAVDVDLVVTENFFLYADETFKATGSFQATFTNPETGQSVVFIGRAGHRTAAGRGRGSGHDHLPDLLQGPPREDPDGTGARLAP